MAPGRDTCSPRVCCHAHQPCQVKTQTCACTEVVLGTLIEPIRVLRTFLRTDGDRTADSESAKVSVLRAPSSLALPSSTSPPPLSPPGRPLPLYMKLYRLPAINKALRGMYICMHFFFFFFAFYTHNFNLLGVIYGVGGGHQTFSGIHMVGGPVLLHH